MVLRGDMRFVIGAVLNEWTALAHLRTGPRALPSSLFFSLEDVWACVSAAESFDLRSMSATLAVRRRAVIERSVGELRALASAGGREGRDRKRRLRAMLHSIEHAKQYAFEELRQLWRDYRDVPGRGPGHRWQLEHDALERLRMGAELLRAHQQVERLTLALEDQYRRSVLAAQRG